MQTRPTQVCEGCADTSQRLTELADHLLEAGLRTATLGLIRVGQPTDTSAKPTLVFSLADELYQNGYLLSCARHRTARNS
jgi:hypothetical protein